MKIWTMGFILCTLILGLSSCAPQAVQPIAAYPKITPIARYPQGGMMVHSAYIELLVSHPDATAQEAISITYSYGGYLISTTSWLTGETNNITLELSIPFYNYEEIRSALVRLGDLSNERTKGSIIIPPYGESQNLYSQITLVLKGKYHTMPEIRIGGWNPLKTLRNALSVFIKIFSFIADILIWLTVVVGPFALIAYLIGWAVHRKNRADTET